MRILFFILLEICIIEVGCCQANMKTIDNFLYNSNSQLFNIISADSLFSYNLKAQLVSKSLFPRKDYDIKALSPLLSSTTSYYPSNETGVVVDDKFNRLDRTIHKNFFMNSSFFVHHDTLFRIGGYGFWTKYRGLSYFDKSQHLWLPYILKAIDGDYEGILNPNVNCIEEGVYVIYAGRTFDTGNPLKEFINNRVFELNFESKSITYRGESSEDLSGQRVVSDDNFLILNKSGLTKLDWKNNIIQFFPAYWTSQVLNEFDVFLINDHFYFIEQQNDTFKLSMAPNNFANLNANYSNEIIKSNNLLMYVVPLGCIVLFIIITLLYRKSNEIVVYKTHLLYRFKTIDIDEFEFKILKLLYRDHKITTNQIHNVLNTKDLHPHHVYRLIPEVMRDLGKTLNLLTSKKELVFSVSKSKTDRRYREYFLNKAFKIRVNDLN